jgi:hypothetical protein
MQLDPDEEKRKRLAIITMVSGWVSMFTFIYLISSYMSHPKAYMVALYVFKVMILVVIFLGSFAVPMITYEQSGRLPMLAFGPYSRAGSPVAVGFDDAYRVMMLVFFLCICIVLYRNRKHADVHVVDLGLIGCVVGLFASVFSVYAIFGPRDAESQVALSI